MLVLGLGLGLGCVGYSKVIPKHCERDVVMSTG